MGPAGDVRDVSDGDVRTGQTGRSCSNAYSEPWEGQGESRTPDECESHITAMPRSIGPAGVDLASIAAGGAVSSPSPPQDTKQPRKHKASEDELSSSKKARIAGSVSVADESCVAGASLPP